MKRSSLLTFFVLILAFSITAQIPNSDFELWEPDNIYEKPVGWTTNNGEYLGTSVKQDTTAYSGNYAIRLFSGNKNTIWAQANFVINFHPQLLNAYVKTDKYPFDSTEIKVYLFYQSMLVDSADSNIKVINSSNYFLVSIPISNNAIQADSAIIQLSASSPSWSQAACIFWVDHLWFDDKVGVQDIAMSNDIHVFPNPANGVVNISFAKKPTVISHITLTDVSGAKYLETTLFQRENKIDIASLKSGVYFVTIKHEETIVVKKILKL